VEVFGSFNLGESSFYCCSSKFACQFDVKIVHDFAEYIFKNDIVKLMLDPWLCTLGKSGVM